MNMIETLNDFITEYSKVKEMGWVKTHRSGPTGIGKTIEDLLGIEENNIDGPDFGIYELKSARINTTSMLTMFTRKPDSEIGNSYLREKFGYESDAYDNDRKVLHSTLTAERFVTIAVTGHKLKLTCDNDRISIESEKGIEPVYWTKKNLQAAFENKYRGEFVYAKALCRGKGANEEFYFTEAYQVSGFDFEASIELLEKGKIFVDLRIGQYPDGSTHDHGTGFRIRKSDEDLLFKIRNRIV